MKRFIFFILFLSLLVSFGNQGWVRLYKLRQFETALEREHRAIADNNASLRREIKNLNEPRYLEQFIRRDIGFIRDNEVIYEFVDEAPSRP